MQKLMQNVGCKAIEREIKVGLTRIWQFFQFLPLKISGVFRGHEMGTLARNGLTYQLY